MDGCLFKYIIAQIIMQRFCLIQTDITLRPSTIQPLIKCDLRIPEQYWTTETVE